jgi:UDP-glucose 4-epimerase
MSPENRKSKRKQGAGRGAKRPDDLQDERDAADPPAPLVPRRTFDPEHRVVAVTGAHSFLGEQIIAQMEQDRRYSKVLAIDIRRPNIPMTKTQFHKVDLTLPNADGEVAHILKREKVDTLVHLAFLSKPTHNTTWAHELEAIGTYHVLNACSACKIHKVVMWSLTAIYGPSPLNPNFLTEDHRPAGVPGSRFFSDKLEAERLARRFRRENPATVVTVLRTASILGHEVHNYISNFLSMPVIPVMMGYDPLVQLLHEDDAVEVFKLTIDADFAGEFNVAGDGVLPLSTVLALSGRVALPVPHFLAYPMAKVFWMTQIFDAPPAYLDFLRYLCVADTSRVRRELGFAPRHDIRRIIADFTGTTSDRTPMEMARV